MIADIYSNAEEVVVFLGDYPHAESALKLLKEIDNRVKAGMPSSAIYQYYLSKGRRPKEWFDLMGLLKLPWFHRV